MTDATSSMSDENSQVVEPMAVRKPAYADRESLLVKLEAFFYARETPYSLALLRITLPWVLMIAALPRWFHVRELFSSDGAPAPLWEGFGSPGLLPILSPGLAVAGYTLLICCLITMSLGWRTRLSTVIVLVLYPYFGLADALSTMTKYTVVATHILLLLACSGCGRVWSIDAWLEQANPASGAVSTRSAVWPRRLIQLLIGLIYLSAAATKMHTPEYFSGDQLSYWMLSNVNLANPLGEYLSLFPAVVVAMGYISIVWEIMFIFLAWKGVGRTIMLTIGFAFHAMTYFILGLIVFPLMFMALYLTFLEEREARAIGEWCQNVWLRLSSVWTTSQPIASRRGPSPAVSTLFGLPAFGSILAAVAFLAVEAEARMDVYGERDPAGRQALRPLSPQRASELLRNDISVRPVDVVFSYDVGTVLVGGVLADRRRQFRHGETVLVQCAFVPPHEDLWIEVNLHDSSDHMIERNGHIAAREDMRTTMQYELRNSLEPGDYALVLKIHGREVARRVIELRP